MVFAFQDSRASVEVAFTDRHGGVSDGELASLNLAVPAGLGEPAHVAREQAAVSANLELLGRAMARGGREPGDAAGHAEADPPTVVTMRQVHGADVHTVDRAWLEKSWLDVADREPAVADALVTDLPGVLLVVRVADCVPVLLADPDRGLVGAAHAGRPGLVAGIVPATVARMRELGAERLVAWLGPHVCGRCYEVPDDMRADVSAVVPEAYAETSWGTPAVDVGAGVTAQLRADGVEVHDASRCTLEDPDLYSYRRQGTASGRLGGLVWVRP